MQETLASAAGAGLPADSYAVIISDNGSDDGSTNSLPQTDRNGAQIILRRNPGNIGRVGNWNRALEVAEEMGFGHAMFLMVGDTLRDTSVLELRDRMSACGAALGLASYEIVDENLRTLRVARRINWRGDRATTPDRFLCQSFGRGAMLYAPLGANLYRLRSTPQLRFDTEDASHTDQRATALYSCACDSPIVYLDRPISRWRRRSGRFHSSLDVEARLQNDFRVIVEACRDAGIEPDYPKIHATMLLRRFFHRNGLKLLGGAGSASAGEISWAWLSRLVFRQLRYNTPWQIEP